MEGYAQVLRVSLGIRSEDSGLEIVGSLVSANLYLSSCDADNFKF